MLSCQQQQLQNIEREKGRRGKREEKREERGKKWLSKYEIILIIVQSR